MKDFFKKYWLSSIIASLTIFCVPLSLFLIFIGGDDCCGANTTGSMLVITTGLSVIYFIGITVVFTVTHTIFSFLSKRYYDSTPYANGLMVAGLPIVIINYLIWLFISIDAFGFIELITFAWL